MQKEDFTKLFSSPELWSVPIESFIEVYCLIFMPQDETEDAKEDLRTARQGDMEERIRIYNDYKKLIGEILSNTILKKKKTNKSQLYHQLSDVIA